MSERGFHPYGTEIRVTVRTQQEGRNVRVIQEQRQEGRRIPQQGDSQSQLEFLWGPDQVLWLATRGSDPDDRDTSCIYSPPITVFRFPAREGVLFDEDVACQNRQGKGTTHETVQLVGRERVRTSGGQSFESWKLVWVQRVEAQGQGFRGTAETRSWLSQDLGIEARWEETTQGEGPYGGISSEVAFELTTFELTS